MARPASRPAKSGHPVPKPAAGGGKKSAIWTPGHRLNVQSKLGTDAQADPLLSPATHQPTMADFDFDGWHMARALELAQRGLGLVEPNPLVGCTIALDGEIVGEGWHRKFGGSHAEIEALRVAGSLARGATLYVTLEPCGPSAKRHPALRPSSLRASAAWSPPWSTPFRPSAAGDWRSCGLPVSRYRPASGEAEARRLNAPYLKLVESGRPWIIAKWAMTLDGKIATRTGDSRWISGAASRQIVHRLRGRVDAIVVGIGTALADDPLLTARPAGVRVATRVVLDTLARLPSTSRLSAPPATCRCWWPSARPLPRPTWPG